MNNDKRVLIEETDAGKRRREQPEERKPKRPKKGWLIALVAVLLAALIAGLAVYYVRSHRGGELVSQTTSFAITAATAEDGVPVEDAFDHVATGEDALGGEMGGSADTGSTTFYRTWRTTASSDEDDADEPEETTRKRTTIRNPGEEISKAVDDFWNEVSKQVG